jgi:hypothetical protein
VIAGDDSLPLDGPEAAAWSWLNQEIEDAPLEATHALPAIAAQVIDATTRRRDIIRDSREREVYTIKHTHGRPRKTQFSSDFRPPLHPLGQPTFPYLYYTYATN